MCQAPQYLNHLILDFQEKYKHRCTICCKLFSGRSCLCRHVKLHENQSIRAIQKYAVPKCGDKYMCIICGQKDKSYTKINVHIETHSQSERVQFGIGGIYKFHQSVLKKKLSPEELNELMQRDLFAPCADPNDGNEFHLKVESLKTLGVKA